MTSAELYRQFLRLQTRNLLGWRSDKECEVMARGWSTKFAHIDADLCEQEMTIELGQPDYPSVGRVLARCLDPQRERGDAKRRAEPEPERPDPWSRDCAIRWRAVRIRLDANNSISPDEAKAQARKEFEAEEAGKDGE